MGNFDKVTHQSRSTAADPVKMASEKGIQVGLANKTLEVPPYGVE